MVLDQGSLYAYYDTGKGLLIPSKYMPEERTEMRAPVSSLLPPGERLAARETKSYSNADYSLSMESRPVKGAYETCKPNSLGKKKLGDVLEYGGQNGLRLMKLDYDNMRVAALFDDQRKLMNAPGAGVCRDSFPPGQKRPGLQGGRPLLPCGAGRGRAARVPP